APIDTAPLAATAIESGRWSFNPAPATIFSSFSSRQRIATTSLFFQTKDFSEQSGSAGWPQTCSSLQPALLHNRRAYPARPRLPTPNAGYLSVYALLHLRPYPEVTYVVLVFT